MSKNLYRVYLAIGQAMERVSACGGKVGAVRFDGEDYFGERYWRARVESQIAAGEVPYLYRWALIQITLAGFDDTSIKDLEEREAQAQKKREDFIVDFVSRYSNAIVARYEDGQSFIYFEDPYDGFGVTLQVGRALCERVLVREDIEEVPDPEALEEALRGIPRVKKVKPVYEWRCNDAELPALGGVL